jgi:hypothetical protein
MDDWTADLCPRVSLPEDLRDITGLLSALGIPNAETEAAFQQDWRLFKLGESVAHQRLHWALHKASYFSNLAFQILLWGPSRL